MKQENNRSSYSWRAINCSGNIFVYPDNPDKPIKIVYEGCLPCPADPQKMCDHSKLRINQYTMKIHCDNYNNCQMKDNIGVV